MKILSIHIDNFGKLSDYDRVFTDGVNCINAENGYGKTTLAVFIKAMLYGLPQTAKRNLSENERKHYFPWQGGVFGGTLDIETDKGRFRISRTFGKKASSDTFSLIDLDTKNPSAAYSENLGTELFGIDAESYEKSTYVPQYDVNISMTSDIGAKLNCLLESSDDMGDLDDAIARIEEYSKRFKHYRGEGGLIGETAARLAKTVEEIEKCKQAESEAVAARASLERVVIETKKCETEIAELGKVIETARAARVKNSQYETYRSYLDDTARAEARLQKFEASLGGNVPNEDDIKEMSACVLKIAEVTAAANEVSNDSLAIARMKEKFGGEPLAEEMLDGLSEKNKQLKETEAKLAEVPDLPKPNEPLIQKTGSVKAAFFVCLAFLLTGGILFFIKLIPAIALVSVGTLGSIVFAVLTISASGHNKRVTREYATAIDAYNDSVTRIAELSAESETIRSELEAVLGKYYPGCPGGIDSIILRLYADSESYRRLIEADSERAARVEKKREELKELSKKADELFSKFGTTTDIGYAEALQKVTDTTRAIAATKEDIEARKRLAIKYAEDKELTGEPVHVSDVSVEESRVRSLRWRANELRSQSGGLMKQVEVLEGRAEALTELLERAAELRAKIADYEEKRATAERAKEFLTMASDRLSSKYLRKMEEGFSEFYSQVEGDGKSADIDTGLGVSFRDGGDNRDPSWYSEGIRSIISVCMRIALTDALFEGEKPFLILDDPFSELDPLRLQKATDLIKRLGEGRQIVYFTCHESREVRS